jgi:ABC-2 type transport system permease protein
MAMTTSSGWSASPLTMPVRIAAGVAEPWEILVSVLLTITSIWLVIRIGARIYMNGILRTGGRVPVREALRRPAIVQ